MEKEVAEKEAARTQLRDRVQILEQRIQQADLSGDEKLTALQNEVSGVSRKYRNYVNYYYSMRVWKASINKNGTLFYIV